MGPRLGRVEYDGKNRVSRKIIRRASMGPRLGRVEYTDDHGEIAGAGGPLQWGHA